MNNKTYTIETTKGDKDGTLGEVCAWQAEYQGGFATLIVDGESFDVSGVDFDAHDLDVAMGEITAMLAQHRADVLAKVRALRPDLCADLSAPEACYDAGAVTASDIIDSLDDAAAQHEANLEADARD